VDVEVVELELVLVVVPFLPFLPGCAGVVVQKE
jgi:hypothetical protein